MQRIYFCYISCFFVKCSKYAKLHSKLWIKGSSLKEVPWNSLFSSSRQKNGIRSINRRYTLLPSLGVQLSGEVPFVISECLVWELPPDNQRVSNSFFERSPIIIVVGLSCVMSWNCLFISEGKYVWLLSLLRWGPPHIFFFGNFQSNSWRVTQSKKVFLFRWFSELAT